MSTETIRRIRDGETGGGRRGYGGGGKGRVYIYRYTVTTKMTPALRRAAMGAILNISLIVRVKVTKTVSTDHNFRSERRAEADSNRGPSLPA